MLKIAENISQRRKEKNIIQEELANFMMITKASVSKWESGQSYPDILLLPKIAAFFNITIAYYCFPVYALTESLENLAATMSMRCFAIVDMFYHEYGNPKYRAHVFFCKMLRTDKVWSGAGSDIITPKGIRVCYGEKI